MDKRTPTELPREDVRTMLDRIESDRNEADKRNEMIRYFRGQSAGAVRMEQHKERQ